MANAHGHSMEIKNPGPYTLEGGLKTFFMVAGVIGAATFIAGLLVDPTRTWATFVMNHFYFFSLALGGMFFAAINWLTNAMWSAPLRRVGEALTGYLPVVLITFVILAIGIHHLYPWSHPEHVKGDLILEGKAGYLSIPFFVIRNLLAVGVFMWFAKKLIGNSLAQDATKDVTLTLRNKSLVPIFLVLFAVLYTMASFDQLMSLDPHWFSTMYGVYQFAGLFYSVLAVICLITIYLKNKGRLEGIVNENHIHDLAKYMFAFTVFWAYIAFCQFMLIWYANLPEETGYYLKRFHGAWIYVSIFLALGKFGVPFFALLPREAKRDTKRLVFVASWMLFAHWVDMLWLVQPEFFVEGPKVGWVEIGMTLGFIGVFGLMVARFFSKHSVVAAGDPRLAEAVHHHHI